MIYKFLIKKHKLIRRNSICAFQRLGQVDPQGQGSVKILSSDCGGKKEL